MRSQAQSRRDSGFTLLEILSVLAIIGVMATIAVPRILQYLRFYQIRSATQELAGALQAARTRAITKSSNWGTVFAIQNAPSAGIGQQTYWVHLEDDQVAAAGARLLAARQPLDVAAPDPAQSTRYRLPGSVIFANAGECTTNPAPSPAFNPADGSIRFNRLGASCDPGAGTCAAPTVNNGSVQNLIDNRTSNSMICLRDVRTGLARWVTIDRGGRVEVQR